MKFLASIFCALTLLLQPVGVFAATATSTPAGSSGSGGQSSAQAAAQSSSSNDPTCGGVKVSRALGACDAARGTNPIFALLSRAIAFFSLIFGLILVGVIVVAGIQYIVAGGSPDDTKEAKDRIKGAATGFILYVLMYGILQILIPDFRVFR